MPVVPLRRNRDFVLLQRGQLLSSAGSESTAIAYPLLVLTQSPAKAGVVAFARVVPFATLGPLAAGVLLSVASARATIAAFAGSASSSPCGGP
ncbi:MAG: hypothetical protein ACRDPC_09220 [Solirubrobacteraceae bacterium]